MEIDTIKEMREHIKKIDVYGSSYIKKWIKEEFIEKLDEMEKKNFKEKNNLICFLDGDALCIVNKNFLNIQRDLSVFLRLSKKDIKEIETLNNFTPEAKDE